MFRRPNLTRLSQSPAPIVQQAPIPSPPAPLPQQPLPPLGAQTNPLPAAAGQQGRPAQRGKKSQSSSTPIIIAGCVFGGLALVGIIVAVILTVAGGGDDNQSVVSKNDTDGRGSAPQGPPSSAPQGPLSSAPKGPPSNNAGITKSSNSGVSQGSSNGTSTPNRGARKTHNYAGWKSHRSSQGAFIVKFPGSVRRRRRRQVYPPTRTQVDVNMSMAKKGQDMFIITHVDLPRSATSGGAGKVIDQFARQWASNFSVTKFKLLNQTSITNSERKGKQYEISRTLQGRETLARYRVFLVGRRAYVIAWMGNPRNIPREDIAAFFDSFKITR